jgi:flagellar biosynthesis chaperone FliJ
LKQEQEYTKSIQAIAKENEERYLAHLNKVRLEYESLQNQMTQLTTSYNNLNKEHATLQGTNIELRSELAKYSS